MRQTRLRDQVYDDTTLQFSVEDEVKREKANMRFLCAYAGAVLASAISTDNISDRLNYIERKSVFLVLEVQS